MLLAAANGRMAILLFPRLWSKRAGEHVYVLQLDDVYERCFNGVNQAEMVFNAIPICCECVCVFLCNKRMQTG